MHHGITEWRLLATQVFQDSITKCSTVCLSICRYSPINNTWQMISNMRVPRDACGVCLMGDRIYVVGGYSDEDEDNKTVEVYNPDRDEWTEVSRAGFPFLLRIQNR